MRLAALTSGGKDSILAICKALEVGHDVLAMITAIPENIESYMFHSANLDAVPIMAERAGMQYIPIKTKGIKEEELDDLKRGIASAKETLHLDGITTGAIASQYQRSRIETICDEIGLVLYAPLWGCSPEAVVDEVIEKLDARIVVTAADGLGENVLGKKIDLRLKPILKAIEAKRRINIAGEGGEYESLVLNAPFFSAPITADGMKISMTGMMGTVTYAHFS